MHLLLYVYKICNAKTNNISTAQPAVGVGFYISHSQDDFQVYIYIGDNMAYFTFIL